MPSLQYNAYSLAHVLLILETFFSFQPKLKTYNKKKQNQPKKLNATQGWTEQ